MRCDNRPDDALRPIRIQRHFTRAAPGSVLIQAGRTVVLCTASIDAGVPPWLAGKQQGWLTAEYSMLPGSTSPRKQRDRGPKVDGRTSEIQRLIGRSFRAVINLAALGERTVTIDCDVLEADGGTRTLSVTGGLVALVDALRTVFPAAAKGGTGDCPDFRGHAQHGRETGTVPFDATACGEVPVPVFPRLPLLDSVAAVSVGIVDGRPVLDLDYREDFAAAVDMNVVMTGAGRFVEVQGTGEESTFTDAELTAMLALARRGIAQLTAIQREALGEEWPFGQGRS